MILLLILVIIILVYSLLKINSNKENFASESESKGESKEIHINLKAQQNKDYITIFWDFIDLDKSKDILYFIIRLNKLEKISKLNEDNNDNPTELKFNNDNNEQYSKNFFEKKLILDKNNYKINVIGFSNNNTRYVSNEINIDLTNQKSYFNKYENKVKHKVQCHPNGDYYDVIDCNKPYIYPTLDINSNLKKLKKLVNTVVNNNIIIK
tara:strand:- start:443 stop:1069 length:627 start_codon:yes stop_codon:yes gene_type:complete